jgi:phosphatidylserine decarboxylase
MKHAGKARSAAFRLVFLSLVAALVLISLGYLAQFLGVFVTRLAAALLALWAIFTGFTFFFFRDPDAEVPTGAGLIVSPGHGKVDAIEPFAEKDFMGGACQRISMFLSVIDVHVQNAPLSGRIALCKHTSGKFLSALKAESAEFNENVLIGMESTERPGDRIAVRLIAGLIARRIVPFVRVGDTVERGSRMSLIQFGSRVDVYLPEHAKIKINLGDRVVGGETVLASFE